jgi:hypothetical protein
MKSTKWTRRQVLKGTGIALSVPWLETFAAREAKAAAVKRYLSVYFPNGTANRWGATGSGAGMTLKPILQPLEPNKSKALVLANVGNYSPWNGHIEPSHGHNSATAWTGVRANGNGNNNSAISIDQVIANQIVTSNGGKIPTPLHSLQLGLSTLKSYFDGLPEPHSRSISWKSASEPLYNIVSPQAAFDRLVAGGLPMGGNMMPMTDPIAQRRLQLKKSALDYIIESSTGLSSRLSTSDRMRMDKFLTSVRSLEQRVAASNMPQPPTGVNCKAIGRPTATYGVGSVPTDYNRGTHATVMIDLIAMTFQCDITRVVSFMLDDARSDFVYNFLKERSFTETGSTPGTAAVGGYHGLQHAGELNNGFATIGYWNMEKVNELVTKISAIQEGTGTAFDGMVLHAMSGMKGGNHDGLDLPIVIMGNGGGVLKNGQAIDFGKTGLPMNGGKNLQDVHLTILNKVFGGNLTQFGTAMGQFVGTTGVINELLA